MIKATELHGRPVVQVPEGTPLGRVQSAVLDLGQGRLVGLWVHDPLVRRAHWVAAEDIAALEDQALTARQAMSAPPEAGPLGAQSGLRDSHDLAGTPVLAANRVGLGTIADVWIDRRTLRIAGYVLAGPLWDAVLAEGRMLAHQPSFCYAAEGLVIPNDLARRLPIR